jgi:lambda repressor-like predicted transcriptional regulator
VQRRLRGFEVDELVEKYNDGQSLHQLGDKFGVHGRTVAAHLERRGVPRRVTSRKLNSTDIEDAARRYQSGTSLATIASAFHVHPETVRRALQREGLKTNRGHG